MVINNCPISKSDAAVLQRWCPPGHLGISLSSNTAYSLSYGVVIFIGQSMNDSTYTVTVQYNSTDVFRYGNIVNLHCAVNQKINPGDVIGSTNGILYFEHCVAAPTNSYSIRISKVVRYRIDPLTCLKSSEAYSVPTIIDHVSDMYHKSTELTELQKLEFINTSGE